jgi:D-sedoheptulose 7-phosphate isomerase
MSAAGEGGPAVSAPDVISELMAPRLAAGEEFFGRESERLARCCHRMAERFARGARLVALGATPAARSDARHVSVEFVHPVIVGKRALPAIALTAEGGPIGEQAAALVRPGDIVIGFGIGESGDEPVATALAAARAIGAMTICFPLAAGRALEAAEWSFPGGGVDPAIHQEIVETAYHVLWELVHVFFDHRGLLEGRDERTVHDTGASSFLYPFLGETERDLDAVLEDVRRSALAKSAEIGALREATLMANAETLSAAAVALRERFEAGGKLLALGNGGSATDAMDVVADFRDDAGGRRRPRRALDLTEDSPILTAVANDVGVEEIFQRQVIAHGAAGDALIAFSTSGGSENLLEALAEARRRGIETIAMVGYGGGRIAAEGLADHVVITDSQNIPRIQEAQASAYHALRHLVG